MQWQAKNNEKRMSRIKNIIYTSICTHLSELGTKENSYKKKYKKKRKQANVSNNNNTLVETI